MKNSNYYPFERKLWTMNNYFSISSSGLSWSILVGMLLLLLLSIESTLSLSPQSFSFTCIPVIVLSSVFLYTSANFTLPQSSLSTFATYTPYFYWYTKWWKWGILTILCSLLMSIGSHFLTYFKEIASIGQVNSYVYLFLFSLWISSVIALSFYYSKYRYLLLPLLCVGMGLSWQLVDQPHFEGLVLDILRRDIIWLVGLLLLSSVAFFTSIVVGQTIYNRKENINISIYLLLASILGLSALYYSLLLVNNNIINLTIGLQKVILSTFLYSLLIALIGSIAGVRLLKKLFFTFFTSAPSYFEKQHLLLQIWGLLTISLLFSNILTSTTWQLICYITLLIYIISIHVLFLGKILFNTYAHQDTFIQNNYVQEGLSLLTLLSGGYLLIELGLSYWITFLLLMMGGICIFVCIGTMEHLPSTGFMRFTAPTPTTNAPNQSPTNYIHATAPQAFKILVPIAQQKDILPLMELAIAIATERQGEIIGLHITQTSSDAITQHRAAPLVAATAHQQYLQLARKQAYRADLSFTGIVKNGGQTAQDILQIAKEYSCQLTILHWKGFSQTPNKQFGHITDTLLKYNHSDTLLVKWGQTPSFKKLLLPYLSPYYSYQRLAEQYGIVFAKVFGGRLLTCNIKHNRHISKTILERELVQISERLHQQNGLEAYCKTIEHHSEVAGILEAAQNCDTIILEATTATILSPATILGHIPEQILQQSTKTVIVVKQARN